MPGRRGDLFLMLLLAAAPELPSGMRARTGAPTRTWQANTRALRLRGGAWVAEDVRGYCAETGPFLEEYALLVRGACAGMRSLGVRGPMRRG